MDETQEVEDGEVFTLLENAVREFDNGAVIDGAVELIVACVGEEGSNEFTQAVITGLLAAAKFLADTTNHDDAPRIQLLN